jgi:hypothetical protein
MNLDGPANRYAWTSGQPLASFSRSVNARTGVPMVINVRTRGLCAAARRIPM